MTRPVASATKIARTYGTIVKRSNRSWRLSDGCADITSGRPTPSTTTCKAASARSRSRVMLRSITTSVLRDHSFEWSIASWRPPYTLNALTASMEMAKTVPPATSQIGELISAAKPNFEERPGIAGSRRRKLDVSDGGSKAAATKQLRHVGSYDTRNGARCLSDRLRTAPRRARRRRPTDSFRAKLATRARTRPTMVQRLLQHSI
jgi:hypothetical protein